MAALLVAASFATSSQAGLAKFAASPQLKPVLSDEVPKKFENNLINQYLRHNRIQLMHNFINICKIPISSRTPPKQEQLRFCYLQDLPPPKHTKHIYTTSPNTSEIKVQSRNQAAHRALKSETSYTRLFFPRVWILPPTATTDTPEYQKRASSFPNIGR